MNEEEKLKFHEAYVIESTRKREENEKLALELESNFVFPEFIKGWDWPEVSVILGLDLMKYEKIDEDSGYIRVEGNYNTLGEQALIDETKKLLNELWGKSYSDSATYKYLFNDKNSIDKMIQIRQFVRLLGNGCHVDAVVWKTIAELSDWCLLKWLENNLESAWD